MPLTADQQKTIIILERKFDKGCDAEPTRAPGLEEGNMNDKEKKENRAKTIEKIKLYMSVMSESQLRSLLGAARGINNAGAR